MKTRLLLVLAVLTATPVFAQLAAPNAAGAAIGHLHINATDMDVQSRFWTTVGGTIVHREKITMVQFPGIYVLLRKQESTGGSVGSTINHFGFYVRDFAGSVTRWKAAGLNWEPVNNPQVGQGFLNGPDGVRVEIYENRSIPTPMQMHHIHLMVPDPLEAQRWYMQTFGATAGKRAQFETVNVPGTEITLSKAAAPQAPTKGRSVDHMGFEVTNIDAFVARLQAAGIKTDAAIRNSANASGLRIVYITDPWGTEIELTEGLAAALPPAYPRPGAEKPVLENDRVLVWAITWLKQEYPLHRHPYDLIGVYYTPGERLIVSENGTRRPVHTEAWETVFQSKGVIHVEEGASDSPLRAIFVEMKEPAALGVVATTTTPPAFPRAGARPLRDNERSIAWEFVPAPGVEPAPHRHLRDAVVVSFTGQTPRVSYVTRGTVHTDEGTAGADRAYVFELK